MYKVVVVGTDGSESANSAVKVAAELARTVGATLHVVTAFRTQTAGLAQVSGLPLIDSGAEDALRAEAARNIAQRAVDEYGAGVDAQFHEGNGDAADVLIEMAESLDADLIVVGSRGMRGARRYLGSVPNSVTHGAPCAVLVVKTD
jgi:nucleotide-binding universal stress UspA family protein